MDIRCPDLIMRLLKYTPSWKCAGTWSQPNDQLSTRSGSSLKDCWEMKPSRTMKTSSVPPLKKLNPAMTQSHVTKERRTSPYWRQITISSAKLATSIFMDLLYSGSLFKRQRGVLEVVRVKLWLDITPVQPSVFKGTFLYYKLLIEKKNLPFRRMKLFYIAINCSHAALCLFLSHTFVIQVDDSETNRNRVWDPLFFKHYHVSQRALTHLRAAQGPSLQNQNTKSAIFRGNESSDCCIFHCLLWSGKPLSQVTLRSEAKWSTKWFLAYIGL